MKTAKRQLKKMHRRTLALLALLVAIAFPAAAHNRTPLADHSPSPATTWNEPLGETTSVELETPLPVVDSATIAAFDEAARIEIDLPADPLEQLDAHLAAIISPAETELLPIVSGLENRCSGFPVSLTEANLKETGELSLKLHWGRDHVRNRWFDPGTGTWLTPDPLGYRDSSNLYAFAGGDPVNGRDPLGLGDGLNCLRAGSGESDDSEDMVDVIVNGLKSLFPLPTTEKPIVLDPAHRPVETFLNAVMIATLVSPFAGDEAAAKVIVETEPLFLRGNRFGAIERTIVSRSAIEATAAPTAGVSESIAARRSYAGRTQFDASKLTDKQVDSAILRSIRRKSGATGNASGQIVASGDQAQFILEKTTAWRRAAKAADPDVAGFDAARKGTILHSSVQKRIRQLNIQDMLVNERLYGTSEFISPATGRLYEYRIPDFRLRNTIFDIKPTGTPLSGPQYTDFKRFAGTDDIRWVSYVPY